MRPYRFDSLRSRRHHRAVFCRNAEMLEARQMLAVLQAGDANQDLYFDASDFVMVAKAGKWLQPQAASWSEGDWNGAPGGSVGSPPAGDREFDNNDLITAFQNGRYYAGKYDASAGLPQHTRVALQSTADPDVTLRYDPATGQLIVDPHELTLTAFHLVSQSQLLVPFEMVRLFDRHVADESFVWGPMGLEHTDHIHRLRTNLTYQQLMADLTVDGARLGGGGLGSVGLVCTNCLSGDSQIDGQVYFDANGNGQRDGTEEGVNGVPVTISAPALGIKMTVVTADDDLNHDGTVDRQTEAGRYRGEFLSAGTYNVSVAWPYSWSPTSVVERQVTLPAASTVSHIDFGATRPALGDIVGQLFIDANENGVRDANESGMNGVAIEITSPDYNSQRIVFTSSVDLNGDGVINETSESGVYQFSDLVPARYKITVKAADGFVPISPHGGVQELTLAAGEHLRASNVAVVQRELLVAGDANQDLYFDEADFILAHKQGKFGNGLPASWMEGDWNATEPGYVGHPGVGDNMYDSMDFVVAFQSGAYRQGAYRASAGEPLHTRKPLSTNQQGDIVITYHPPTGMLEVVSKSNLLSTFHLSSTVPLFESSLDTSGLFDAATPTSMFRLNPSGFSTLTIQAAKLKTKEQLLSAITVDGSLLVGGDIGAVTLECPQCVTGEPASIRGQLFLDANNNGVRDGSEVGVNSPMSVRVQFGGTQFTLSTTTGTKDLNGDGQIDPVTEIGIYEFNSMPAGSFVVIAAPPLGFATTTIASTSIVLTAGGRVDHVDFGIAVSPYLQPGDANKDFYFDPADLIQVFKAGKFLRNADWSQGDWDGGPGGSPSHPPVGDGQFNYLDLDRALATGVYLQGRYQPTVEAPHNTLQALVPGDSGDVVVRYNRQLRSLTIDSRGDHLSTLHITSKSSLFTDTTAHYSPMGSAFSVASSHELFAMNEISGVESLTIHLEGQPTEAELLDDLRIDGSRTAHQGETHLSYDPRTGSLTIMNTQRPITVFEFVSRGSLFRPENANPDLFSGLFDVRRADKLFRLFPAGMAGVGQPLTLGNVLPPGLTISELEADLQISGAYLGGGGMDTVLVSALDQPPVPRPLELGVVSFVCECRPGDSELRGVFFQDTNANGQRDNGEPPLNGLLANLYDVETGLAIGGELSGIDLNQDGTVDEMEAGAYRFPHLANGTYRLETYPPRGYQVLSPPNGTQHIQLTGEQSVTVQNIAVTPLPPAFIRTQVFNDKNYNGVHDAGEPGVNGQTIRIESQDGIDVYPNLLTSSVDWNQDGVIDPTTEQGWVQQQVIPVAHRVLWSGTTAWQSTTAFEVLVSPVGDERVTVLQGIGRNLTGDLNSDRLVDVGDIEILQQAVRGAGRRPARYDLDHDRRLSISDVRFLVEQILETSFGDVNLDGRFNSSDLVAVWTQGEYEDTTPGNSTWRDGDWNGDGEFDAYDLVFAFQQGGYVAEAVAFDEDHASLIGAALSFEPTVDAPQETAVEIDRPDRHALARSHTNLSMDARCTSWSPALIDRLWTDETHQAKPRPTPVDETTNQPHFSPTSRRNRQAQGGRR